MSNVQQVFALVQGSRVKADDLEGAVELVFTKIMPEYLRNLTEEAVQTYKTGLEELIMHAQEARGQIFRRLGALPPDRRGGECLLDEVGNWLGDSAGVAGGAQPDPAFQPLGFYGAS